MTLPYRLNRHTINQILRFVVTGLTAALVDLAAYYTFSVFAPIALSKSISFLVATVYTYIMNKFWTFRTGTGDHREIARYIAWYCVVIVLNVSVNQAVYWGTGHKMFAFVIATGVGAVVNFIGLKCFVFKKNRPISMEA